MLYDSLVNSVPSNVLTSSQRVPLSLLRTTARLRGFTSKVDFGGNEGLIRVTSWIVSFVRKTKDDPRSHTNQHEAKHSCLELDPTFEAKHV
jgi:hypothetical protein